VWAAGADVIALDATGRQRPEKEDLASLIQRSKEELGAPLMADVDSIENGLIASSLGCEWVGTTLYGYTEQTSQQTPPGYRLISPLRDQLPDQVTLICEGGIKSPDSALQALEHGADLVVVGTAITGVDLQVADYIRALDRQSG
jgi:N-acylglucosamine-6-phosphate 2-epimerase